tara:strand:+ start:208 stop:708 length:501 start_codon:yes stop_codon:yes gene_type:complete
MENNDYEIIKEYTNKNTELFTLNNINTYAKVVHIVDGDTINIVIKLYDNYCKLKLRLNNIDTCETRGNKNEETRNKGILAKNRLYNLITSKDNYNDMKSDIENNTYIIWVKLYKYDKYGRVLADIYKYDNESISFSDILVNEKLAYIYNGGGKLTDNEQLDILNNI